MWRAPGTANAARYRRLAGRAIGAAEHPAAGHGASWEAMSRSATDTSASDESNDTPAPAVDGDPGRRRTLSASSARRLLVLLAIGAIVGGLLAVVIVDRSDGGEVRIGHGAVEENATISSTSFGQADPGTCLQWTPSDDPALDRTDIAAVDCTSPHRFEVAADVDLSVFPGRELGSTAPYPGQERFAMWRDEQCGTAVRNYLDGKFDPTGRYSIGMMYPSSADWDAGVRRLRCGVQVVESPGVPLETTGSVRDQDQSSTWPAGTCIGVAGGEPTVPVDCSTGHAFEVISVVDLTTRFTDGSFPSVTDQDQYLEDTCTQAATEYLGSPDELRNKTLTLFWENVDVSAWLAGSRQVGCMLGKEGDGTFATIVGSATGDITIDGQPPVAPPPLGEGRRQPVPLPGAAPFEPGN